MPKIKDLKHLPGDIAYKVMKGKGEAASEIHYSLQERSPWFTGTFNTAWEIKAGSPVAPVLPRKGEGNRSDDDNSPEKTGRKSPVRDKVIITSLTKAIYVGNKTEYAGFVINAMTSPYEPGQMYEDLFRAKRKTTPKPNTPFWYYVYLQNNFLEKDINKGFQIAGFKPKRNYTMHKGTSA